MLFVNEDHYTMKSISGKSIERRDVIAADMNLEKTCMIGGVGILCSTLHIYNYILMCFLKLTLQFQCLGELCVLFIVL